MIWLTRIGRRAAIILGFLIGCAVVWMLTASSLLAYGLRIPWTPWDWYTAIHVWGFANWWVDAWEVGSAVAATMILIVPTILLLQYRLPFLLYGRFPRLMQQSSPQPLPVVRGHSDNYGHAYVLYGGSKEVRDLWPASSGLVMGEDYDPTLAVGRRFDPRNPRTWGDGGKTRLLIDSCSAGPTHVRGVIIPSGGGKTAMLATTLFYERRSVLVHDPSLQLAPMFAPELFPDADGAVPPPGVRSKMGHDVYLIAPGRPGPNVLEGILKSIDENDPNIDTKILSMLERVIGHIPDLDDGGSGNSFFFRIGSQQLVACLLYAVLYATDVEPDVKTLVTMRAPLSMTETELRDIIKRIYLTSSSERAKQLAGPMVELIKETFDGIFKGADQITQWLTSRANGQMVSAGAFPIDKIIDGKTDIFVAIPLDVLDHTPALARTIVGSAIDAVFRADGRSGEVHLLIDEARRFNHFRPFKLVRDGLRKYGILLTLYYQHTNQIREQWGGQGALDEWHGAMAALTFAGISDFETAEWISKSIGTMPALSWSDTDNTGRQAGGRRSRGWTRSYNEQSRRVKLPEELMYDLPADALVILIKGHRPVICGMPLYFRRPELASQLPQDRFVRRSTAA